MQFCNFVRRDIKFQNLDELKAQLAQDKLDVLALLAE